MGNANAHHGQNEGPPLGVAQSGLGGAVGRAKRGAMMAKMKVDDRGHWPSRDVSGGTQSGARSNAGSIAQVSGLRVPIGSDRRDGKFLWCHSWREAVPVFSIDGVPLPAPDWRAPRKVALLRFE